jgi:hypothetical protein
MKENTSSSLCLLKLLREMLHPGLDGLHEAQSYVKGEAPVISFYPFPRKIPGTHF